MQGGIKRQTGGKYLVEEDKSCVLSLLKVALNGMGFYSFNSGMDDIACWSSELQPIARGFVI